MSRPRPRLCAAGVTLRNQVNKRWPNRDKSSDGWIGDARHQANRGWGTNGKGSYHNPDPNGIVHAIDIDEDFFGRGRGQVEARRFAEELAAYCRDGKDGGRIAHIVYEDQVASGTAQNWKFRGSGFGHRNHIHISFTHNADNDGSFFRLPIFRFDEVQRQESQQDDKQEPMPKYPGRSLMRYGQKNNHIKDVQMHLKSLGYVNNNFRITGEYNDQTAAALQKFYLEVMNKQSDGKTITPAAWGRILGGIK